MILAFAQQAPTTYSLEQVLPLLITILTAVAGAFAIGLQQIIKGYFAFVEETKKENASLRAEISRQQVKIEASDRLNDDLKTRIGQLEDQQAEAARKAALDRESQESQIAILQKQNGESETTNAELRRRIALLESQQAESDRRAVADRESKEELIATLQRQVESTTTLRQREQVEHEERLQASTKALKEAIEERNVLREWVNELTATLERETRRVDELTARLDNMSKGNTPNEQHPTSDPGSAVSAPPQS